MNIPDRAYHIGDNKEIVIAFSTDISGAQVVTVAVGAYSARVPVWMFNRDMLIVSEESAFRAGKDD